MNDTLAYLLVAAGLVALAFRLGGRSERGTVIGPASAPPMSLLPKGSIWLKRTDDVIRPQPVPTRLTRGGGR
jgi:hypothetical protein